LSHKNKFKPCKKAQTEKLQQLFAMNVLQQTSFWHTLKMAVANCRKDKITSHDVRGTSWLVIHLLLIKMFQ